MSWVAFLGRERSPEELAEARRCSSAWFDIDKFTCDDCRAQKTCDWAFDPYNTDGDCLAEK